MILVKNKVVIAIMDYFEQKENGKLINGSIYPMGEVVEVESPSNVIPQKYCYDETNGFYENEVWLQSTQKAVEDAEENLLIELMSGGM